MPKTITRHLAPNTTKTPPRKFRLVINRRWMRISRESCRIRRKTAKCCPWTKVSTSLRTWARCHLRSKLMIIALINSSRTKKQKIRKDLDRMRIRRLRRRVTTQWTLKGSRRYPSTKPNKISNPSQATRWKIWQIVRLRPKRSRIKYQVATTTTSPRLASLTKTWISSTNQVLASKTNWGRALFWSCSLTHPN